MNVNRSIVNQLAVAIGVLAVSFTACGDSSGPSQFESFCEAITAKSEECAGTSVSAGFRSDIVSACVNELERGAPDAPELTSAQFDALIQCIESVGCLGGVPITEDLEDCDV